MVVLIPAYEPDHRLPELVADLRGTRVVVVDDGSGPAYAAVFDEVLALGAELVRHPENRGKGLALKTGFAHVALAHPGEPVVCADSDGQHSPVDILRVAAELRAGDADMVLGARRFTDHVPARSPVRNGVARRAFALATRRTLVDTQTGLRAYPSRLLPWLASVPGERFEYELRLLLRARAEGLRVDEVDIATIYLDENASSHFRPVRDSLLVYGQLLSFAAASLAGFTVDVVALTLLMALTGHLLLAVAGARLLSATVNYTLNRRWVFGSSRSEVRTSLPRYAVLAAGILLANALLMHLLVPLTGSLLRAKVVTELALFLASFGLQRALVFRHGPVVTRPASEPLAAPAMGVGAGASTRRAG